jgi:hypothetical protein
VNTRGYEELNKLHTGSNQALHLRYTELFGEAPRSRNRVFLIRRIAWRLQANAHGDLSERARRRALEIAHDADLRLLPPDHSERRQNAQRQLAEDNRWDRRIPLPGTVLTRLFQGRTIQVKVLPHGFEYDHQWFRSLSGIAEQITGTRWNGFVFFGLKRRPQSHAA